MPLSKFWATTVVPAGVFYTNSPVSGPCSGSCSFFLSVMSLWDTRKRTTSPFSFLIGTMSRRHQNFVPGEKNKCKPTINVVFRNRKVEAVKSFSPMYQMFQSYTSLLTDKVCGSLYWTISDAHKCELYVSLHFKPSETVSDSCYLIFLHYFNLLIFQLVVKKWH